MMNTKNASLEPTTDLRLTLGYLSRCVQRTLNGDSGAGVNAASRVNMAFAATDPLSELVWCPHKGLSLRCADHSFVSKKSSHFWDAGPSSVVLSLQQGIVASTSPDRITDETNFLTPEDTLQTKSEFPEVDPLARQPIVEVGNMAEEPSNNHDTERGVRDMESHRFSGNNDIQIMGIKSREDNLQGQGDGGAPEISSSRKDELNTEKFEELSGNVKDRGTDVSIYDKKMGEEVEVTFEVNHVNDCKAQPSGIRDEDATSAQKEQAKNKMEKFGNDNSHPLERLESTAENDLQSINLGNVLDVAAKNVASGSCQEPGNHIQQSGHISHDGKNVSRKHCPMKTRAKMCRKKQKEILSDEGDKVRVSKDDNESHGSVESCNSAGLFSSGKKRCNFEEQLSDGRKRCKMQINDSPSSSAYIKNDSSFMNWISNVMKGFTRSMDAEAPTLALTFPHPNTEQEIPDDEPSTHDIKDSFGVRNTGFKSIFQSLYSPNTKVLEPGSSYPSNAGEGSTKLEVINDICTVNPTPIACHGPAVGRSLLPIGQFDESTSGSGAGFITHQNLASHAVSLKNSETKSAENKGTCNLVFCQEKNGSSSSQYNPKINSAGNSDPELPPKETVTRNSGHRGDLLSSLWIKRFSPKYSGPCISNQDVSSALDFPADGSRPMPCYKDHVSFSNEYVAAEERDHVTAKPLALMDKEFQDHAARAEDSVGYNRDTGYSSFKSIQNLNSVLPTERDKNSEAMASTFARRLDALRHINLPDATCGAPYANITCFFCGTKGHRLQECPDVSTSEVSDLLRNVNLFSSAEDPPCRCIKCFQFNHWAVACPDVLSKGKQQLQSGALVDSTCPSRIHFTSTNENTVQMQERKECQSLETGTHVIHQDGYGRQQANLNAKRESNAMVKSDHVFSLKEFVASSSKLDINKAMPLPESVSYQNADEPNEMFELVKQLRLSRATILKWMDSHTSLPHLGGFFLRLRLGKWEEGLGGTGYYVACINGVEGEKHAKNQISVNIGGINCLVESQYVSNNDFLQEELMAWWSSSLRSGGHIPSKEELRTKVEERRTLGV